MTQRLRPGSGEAERVTVTHGHAGPLRQSGGSRRYRLQQESVRKLPIGLHFYRRLVKINLPRPGAGAERYRERARRKNRRNSSAISRIFSRTKATRAPAIAAAAGKLILISLLSKKRHSNGD